MQTLFSLDYLIIRVIRPLRPLLFSCLFNKTCFCWVVNQSGSDMLCICRFFSAHHICEEHLFDLLFPFSQHKSVWLFSSHPLTWYICMIFCFSCHFFFVNSRWFLLKSEKDFVKFTNTICHKVTKITLFPRRWLNK